MKLEYLQQQGTAVHTPVDLLPVSPLQIRASGYKEAYPTFVKFDC